jgi:hypothetical protein
MVESVEVEAAYTFPLASTPRPDEVRPVNRCVPTVIGRARYVATRVRRELPAVAIA